MSKAERKAAETVQRFYVELKRYAPNFNPELIRSDFKLSANGRSCKFAVVVVPYIFFDNLGDKHWRHGARWILHVGDILGWSLDNRDLLVSLTINEVLQYITEGYIDRNETTTIDTDDGDRVRLQRAGNRDIN